MIRPIYRLNSVQKRVPIFSDDFSPDTRENLNGFRPLPPEFGFEWQFYFELGGNPPDMPVQKAYRIDQQLVNPLGHLPPPVAVDPGVLAQRNLLTRPAAGAALGPVSCPRDAPAPDPGRRPARRSARRAAGAAHRSRRRLQEQRAALVLMGLREAELFHEGNQLGPVGGRIVAETFVGILSEDKLSYQSVDPAWIPDLANPQGAFGMPDLIRFALGR